MQARRIGFTPVEAYVAIDSEVVLHDFVMEPIAAMLNRVEIRAAVGNERSRSIPERLGFRQEGVLRKAELVGDRYVDHAVYATLASEWRSAND